MAFYAMANIFFPIFELGGITKHQESITSSMELPHIPVTTFSKTEPQ